MSHETVIAMPPSSMGTSQSKDGSLNDSASIPGVPHGVKVSSPEPKSRRKTNNTLPLGGGIDFYVT
jgi:hypothetical protein